MAEMGPGLPHGTSPWTEGPRKTRIGALYSIIWMHPSTNAWIKSGVEGPMSSVSLLFAVENSQDQRRVLLLTR